MSEFKRLGGKLESRPLHFFLVVDCSGSMCGEKINALNHAIQATIPDLYDIPDCQLLIRVLQFSTGASWVTSAPVNIEDFTWKDLEAGGGTDLGKALDLLSAQLTIPPMPDCALPPIIVLIMDGTPTDEYKKSLEELLNLRFGKKAVRVAVAIGKDANEDMLTEFTGTGEAVLQVNNPQDYCRIFKLCLKYYRFPEYDS
ncbi:MAG: VWA domain-containing protein [Firmicutes bacterium]|nr:VWA domain-containing protein [Bacillota bacterium]